MVGSGLRVGVGLGVGVGLVVVISGWSLSVTRADGTLFAGQLFFMCRWRLDRSENVRLQSGQMGRFEADCSGCVEVAAVEDGVERSETDGILFKPVSTAGGLPTGMMSGRQGLRWCVFKRATVLKFEPQYSHEGPWLVVETLVLVAVAREGFRRLRISGGGGEVITADGGPFGEGGASSLSRAQLETPGALVVE